MAWEKWRNVYEIMKMKTMLNACIYQITLNSDVYPNENEIDKGNRTNDVQLIVGLMIVQLMFNRLFYSVSDYYDNVKK